MFDLHCHFLPGIDDGASTLDESLALASHAVQSGITHSVVTPHLHFGRYENYLNVITSVFKDFRNAVNESGIKLQLGFAAEVRICPEIMIWVQQGKIPFLGEFEGSRVLLLELPHNQILPGWDNLLRWLSNQNIRPMIAHPERNKEIMASPEKILPLFNAGALFQLTAGAVAGLFGEKSQMTAKYILDKGLATILASDAHNMKHRPPELEHGRRQVEAWLGESVSWDMVVHTPAEIVANKF
jgi:protein-tyrosine phosphatase